MSEKDAPAEADSDVPRAQRRRTRQGAMLPVGQHGQADVDAQAPQGAVQMDDSSGGGLAGVASTIVGAAGPVLSAARRPVGHLASGARRLLDERSGARVRRVRRMGRQPLANLWEMHPEARRAAIRDLGLQTVLIEEIAGTAVEGAAQRGGDFLPLRDRRSDDWRARWQRILSAVDGLVNLPPIELLKFGTQYWVVDGHNRVAAALYSGQVAIDAVVYELRLAGVPSQRSRANIAPYLEGSLDLRAAGSGRLTRTTNRPDAYELSGPEVEKDEQPADATDDEGGARRGPAE